LASAIIPARNEEAAIRRAIESVAAQPEVEEIIVVNDQSTDRTGAILAELAARIPKVRVLTTGGLPDGWVGKNYAASIGAAAARGDWLLFTDADTYHMLGSTRRALEDAVDHDAVLVSYSPEQEVDSFWERAMIPFVYCRLAVRFSYARVNDPASPDAAANGQFLMILREVYEAIGGHAAVSGDVLEDVALARHVKTAGYRIYFTAPIGVIQTRMYRSFGAMWQGWTKNLYPLVGGTPRSMFAELRQVVPWVEILLLILYGALPVRTGIASPWMLLLLIALMLLLRHLRYGLLLYRNLYRVSHVQYYGAGVALYTAALVASWWKNTRGSVEWKGRTYAARAHPSSS
jgi:glycosyltransferase involved in cell wall biosynthesis